MPDRYAEFLLQHRLPPPYLTWAQQHFEPVIAALSQGSRPQVLGINGCQGSGKSTLAAYLALALEVEQGLRVACLSMDDFYLTRAQRQQLAQDVHPLLATRGVPGTHDVELAQQTLTQLLAGKPTQLPRFDKGQDDRVPTSLWQSTAGAIDIVLLEGWCLGAVPETHAALLQPINNLEATEDARGIWRRYVNESLSGNYQAWFAQVERWLMLKAPDFDAVLTWRWQQEQKLAETLRGQVGQKVARGLMNFAQTQRFVQHYQRLTEHLLVTLPANVNHLYQLNSERQIIHEQHLEG